MPDPPPTGPAAPPPALDRDLYCLTCGYNLRGLSGDPVRCPECGNWNPIGDLTMPAELIAKQLRRMESAPAICVGSLLLLAGGQALCWSVALTKLPQRQTDLGFCAVCMGVPTLACLAAWIWGMFRFRSSCLGKVGWGTVLARYHLCGFMGSAAIIAPLVLITWLLWPGTTSTHWGRGALTHAVVIGAVFTLCVLGLRPLFRRQYARLTQDMQVLQREVATQIVRDRTRRRMAQARRGWF